MSDDIRGWGLALLALWNSLLTGVVLLRKPGVDAANAVAALSARVDTIDAHLKHMPTSEELAELEGVVKAIDASTRATAERIGALGAAINRIESYLLNSKSS